MIAVSADTVEQSRGVVAREGLSFPLMADPDFAVIDRWDLRHVGAVPGRDAARPAVFLLDADGVVRWRWLTENYRVRLRPAMVREALTRLE